jgi:hypothetical protein
VIRQDALQRLADSVLIYLVMPTETKHSMVAALSGYELREFLCTPLEQRHFEPAILHGHD